MAYKDFSNGVALPETDLDELSKQTVMKYASAAARTADAALTAALREGMFSYLDDLNVYQVYTGAAWSTIGPVHGVLTGWTPTITQLGAVTVTVGYAKYMRIGRMVQHWFNLTATSAGTVANQVVLGGLPFTLATSGLVCGQAMLIDVSAPNAFQANLYTVSTTTLDFRSSKSPAGDPRLGIAEFVSAVASGDVFTGSFCAEVAADA